MSGAHRRALEALDVPGPARAPLESYLELLATWNRRVNLTGARSAAERVAVLVAPVLPAATLLGRGRLLDLGSGNGSPGLVLALLRPDLEVTLLEPRARRWAFLREAVRALGRPGIRVLRGRHSDYPGPPVQSVTLRGLRLPLAELAALLREGGALLVFGGAPLAAVAPFALEAEHPGAGARLRLFRRERST